MECWSSNFLWPCLHLLKLVIGTIWNFTPVIILVITHGSRENPHTVWIKTITTNFWGLKKALYSLWSVFEGTYVRTYQINTITDFVFNIIFRKWRLTKQSCVDRSFWSIVFIQETCNIWNCICMYVHTFWNWPEIITFIKSCFIST